MRKAFTLVEMLIVVVVLVTLMTITFRLSSLGDDQTRRSATISRLQRVENCLSGYYAAFGSYPPVKSHGYSDFRRVNSHGMQQETEATLGLGWYKSNGSHGIGDEREQDDWKIVRAVCMNQPVAVRFPYPEGYKDIIEAQVSLAQERLETGEDTNTDTDHKREIQAGWDDGYTSNAGRHDLDESSWQEVQLFQFGLMSYLLPRYLVMMCSGDNANDFYTHGQQWLDNNTLPCDPTTGNRDWSWNTIKSGMQGIIRGVNGSTRGKKDIYQKVKLIASQSVCARWLPNLEESCYTDVDFSLFGIDIQDSSQELDTDFGICAPGGSKSSGMSQQYVLCPITVTDGWHQELYYYSPKPYQTYTLWSSGPNERTFPPWLTRERFNTVQNQCIGVWIDDDIVNMSH